MVDLILRPSDRNHEKPFALQLRDHQMAETAYHTIAYVTREMAFEIIAAGAPTWLFGEPEGGRYGDVIERVPPRKETLGGETPSEPTT
jgi:hypothetical protein